MSEEKSPIDTLNSADVKELFAHAMTSRSTLLQKLIDPRRDIADECGYPDIVNLSASDFKDEYLTECVATRIVEVYPQECWQVTPGIFEDEDNEETTPFEESLKEVQTSLQGVSWYQGTKGNPLWEKLCRADILSGIGRYGIILLGIDDGKKLSEPAEGINDSGDRVGFPKRKLLYMRVFDESQAAIKTLETIEGSPRYGQPKSYSVTFANLNNPSGYTDPNTPESATKEVHWTRVIHVADNLMSSELFGRPRLLPVFKRVFDIKKLYSGSAEMYWRGAFPGVSIETHPQLGGDVAIDTAAVRTAMEKYMTGLQRYLLLGGASAKSLAPQVSDPTAQINTQIEGICIQIAVPKRVFVGSERGELSSAQDSDTWKDRLRSRQNGHITPHIIVPVINRLISLGVLVEPKQYDVSWQDFDNMSDEQQADIAVKRTQAMAQYVGGSVENLITPLDYLITVIGMEKKEAEEVLKTTTAVDEDDQFTITPEPDPVVVPGQIAGAFPPNKKQASTGKINDPTKANKPS